MKFLGNLTEDQIIDFKFSTHTATGAPITLAGTPVVKVYKGNATDSEVATGVALSVNFDGVTGLHHVRIDTSAAAFYAVANDYSVVITAGTVDGVSVVGTVLATFSIENRSGDADLADIKSATTELLTRVPDATAGEEGGLPVLPASLKLPATIAITDITGVIT